ncbi:MAG: Gfo/Idh/MocA family oxidoreductase [Planctomycetota bacterium]
MNPSGYRIGVVGCGAVAAYGHLPAIAETPQLRLTALLDPDPERLAEVGRTYGLPDEALCTEPEAFYAHKLDAVSVTSPAPAHRQNVLDAVAHGVPILCEKPLAMDRDEARDMVEAADDAGVMLAVAFCYRYSPAAQLIKRLVDESAIGDLRTLRLVFNWACHGATLDGGAPCDPAVAGSRAAAAQRRAGRMLEGGPMVDCGTHQIDLAQWWTGSPVAEVAGHGSWVEGFDAPDHVWAHLDHENGAHTVVEISFSYGHTTPHLPKHFRYELIGTRGVIEYDREARSLLLHNAEGEHVLPFAPEKNFAGAYACFVRSLHAGEIDPDLVDGWLAMETTRLARASTEQAIARRSAVRTD